MMLHSARRVLFALLLLAGAVAVCAPIQAHAAGSAGARRAVQYCPRCHAAIKPGWLFCDQCGLRLSARGPAPQRKASKPAANSASADGKFVILSGPRSRSRPTPGDESSHLLVDTAGVAASVLVDGKARGTSGKEIA